MRFEAALIFLLFFSVSRCDPLGSCSFTEAEEEFCYATDHVTCAFAYGGTWIEGEECSAENSSAIMSRVVVLNLTPHPINIGDRVFLPSGRPARAIAPNDPRPLPDKADEMGVPVVEAYDYTEFEGLPREELKTPGRAVIVSQLAADWLRALGPFGQKRYLGLGTRVYTPDTDKGAVRDANGAIRGTKRLVFQFETPLF